MAILKPNDFIKSVLIDEVAALNMGHPYISFIVMGIGIEFLGKAIDTSQADWNVRGRSSADFKNAIKAIPALRRYEPYLTTHQLYESLRCGLAHSIAPQGSVTLSSKEEMGHLIEHNGQVNLKAEDFYIDFKLACEFVVNQTYPPGDKMTRAFLYVPGASFDAGTNISAGITSSIAPPTSYPSASGTTAPMTFGSTDPS